MVFGSVALSLFQFSGVILSVELVTCLTPIAASVLIRLSGSSFTDGIIGSMRAVVGTFLSVRVLSAFSRCVGGGAFGSMSLAMSSLSVVMVMETVEGTLFRRSVSLMTRLDFVIICSLQSCLDRISRHSLVKPVLASRFG